MGGVHLFLVGDSYAAQANLAAALIDDGNTERLKYGEPKSGPRTENISVRNDLNKIV
jgi:hypothetical protein